MKIRNIAIIAHVDHGKTTLVDGLLKQSKIFRENEAMMSQDLIMDSNEQERERGITILAKNTSVTYKDVKINIIDTPGHADFGGEVERTLNMADGALLLVDAQEGPMPQTKFVLKKALDLGLKVIVVVNKIDKENVHINHTLNKISDLFLELAKHESHLDFPVLYAIGREGKAWSEYPSDFSSSTDLTPIFEAILKFIPEPVAQKDGHFQILVTSLDWDNYKGLYSIGRITRGIAKPGLNVTLINKDSGTSSHVIENVYVSQGLKRVAQDEVQAGDIVALTGIKGSVIGDTIADAAFPEPLPTIQVDEPTLRISIGPNTSPLRGKEGSQLTGVKILERIKKELQTNVSMKFSISDTGSYILSGRGELHLSVFLETLRREGFEIEVGKPQVITKQQNGETLEPVEELIVDVETIYASAVTGEIVKRRGHMISQEDITSHSTRLTFQITTRGMLGLRAYLLTLSKGTAVMNSSFLEYQKKSAAFSQLRKGVLVASEDGTAVSYGLNIAHEKGPVYIEPGAQVYQGMIIGLNARDEDLEINVCKEKKLTNIRSSGETAIILSPSTKMSLEQCLGFLEDDELLEITPKSLRLRKKILNGDQRRKASKHS